MQKKILIGLKIKVKKREKKKTNKKKENATEL